MGSRITQENAEVYAIPDDLLARITQEVAEVYAVPDTQTARITQIVAEVWVTPVAPGEAIRRLLMGNRGDVIKKTQNTVWIRDASGFDAADWMGKCARIDDMARPRGGLNPNYCQNVRDGGVEITGTTRTLAGLPTSQIVAKETIVSTQLDRLENCRWTFDRRTHCKDLDNRFAWEKIRRLCLSVVDTRTDMGSDFDQDETENMTTMPVVGEEMLTINRVNVSNPQQDIESVAEIIVAGDVCHGERCGSRCNADKECVVVFVTALVAAGTAHLLVNDAGGAGGHWTDIAITEFDGDDARDVICLGDFVLIAGDNSNDSAFVRSYDQGTNQQALAGSTDMATNPVTRMDAITQAFIVAVAENGYIYGSGDSGSSWTTLDAGLVTTQDYNNVEICRANPDVIYAVGNNNRIAKTENGGQSWFLVTGPSAGDNLFALYVYDENHIIVGNDDGEIWQTSDGGETWTQQETPYGLTPAAGSVIIKEIISCGCDVAWMLVKDTSVTSFSLDTEQYVFRSVENGASGSWYLPNGGELQLLNGQTPETIVCCGPNLAIVAGGEAATSSFVSVIS